MFGKEVVSARTSHEFVQGVIEKVYIGAVMKWMIDVMGEILIPSIFIQIFIRKINLFFYDINVLSQGQ